MFFLFDSLFMLFDVVFVLELKRIERKFNSVESNTRIFSLVLKADNGINGKIVRVS